jgi:hypothetical protein
MQKHETVDTFEVPANEAIRSVLGPGALATMAARLRTSSTGWIVPVGGGVTHTIIPVADTILGRRRWTVAHWVTVEGRDPVRMDTIDDFGAFVEISLAIETAVEMAEHYANNPRARTACAWCFATMSRDELAQGHNCPV